MKPIAFILLLAPLSARAAATQQVIGPVQTLDFDRPESWGMAYFTSATLMNGFSTPRPLKLGQMRVALAGAWIPELSDEQRRIGFNGTKSEDVNRLPVFGRLQITIGLPWLLSLTIGYLPPIPINGVQAHLLSGSLGRPFYLTTNFALGASLYGQVGSVIGPFTCSPDEASAGADPQKNPLGCHERSNDEINMRYLGFELSASYRIVRAHRLEPYAGVAVNYMNLLFEVKAQYGDVTDRTWLKTQGATFSTTGGLLLPITRRLDVAAEVFYTPLMVHRPQNASDTVEGLLNVRGLVAYRFF
jgi:hypothetical protein